VDAGRATAGGRANEGARAGGVDVVNVHSDRQCASTAVRRRDGRTRIRRRAVIHRTQPRCEFAGSNALAAPSASRVKLHRPSRTSDEHQHAVRSNRDQRAHPDAQRQRAHAARTPSTKPKLFLARRHAPGDHRESAGRWGGAGGGVLLYLVWEGEGGLCWTGGDAVFFLRGRGGGRGGAGAGGGGGRGQGRRAGGRGWEGWPTQFFLGGGGGGGREGREGFWGGGAEGGGGEGGLAPTRGTPATGYDANELLADAQRSAAHLRP